MNFRTSAVASFLFLSGLCALVYQTVWMREFRLVFGASTPATAAVLAIFMGGLGAGAAILGRRSDRHARPLAFYAALEGGIAVSAALTPFLIDAVRSLYLASGGSVRLGSIGATVVRILLACVVLAVPTFLMGGTLSAAARAIATPGDVGRRGVALLYAANTTGAVTGVLIAGFWLVERYGNRRTLWLAAIVNLVVAIVARIVSKAPSEQAGIELQRPRTRQLPRSMVLAVAALSGLVFFLMELVWYRVLSPILGGTTFMFALVLAMALAGIGIGGAVYAARRGSDVPLVGQLAVTFAAEAFALAVPYALGDRLALLANALRSDSGFGPHVAGWALVTAIVVLPASIVAGVQFPLMIALLGRGREEVGRDVGMAYAWNTAGAIAGSLLGGFGLIPLLGAIGCWRACVAAWIVVAAMFALRAERTMHVVLSAFIGAAALVSLFATGPTALWRHSSIGAGRAPVSQNENEARAWAQTMRRTLLVERDGRESSVALMSNDDLGLIVNGKSDGSARADAGTQVMAGMIAALLHPRPQSAMVVGLGTGTTAGWIAAVPTVDRVVVAEIEPAIIELAASFASVNRNVLADRKVRIASGDAREVLLGSRDRYDIIFSEPSNPYRAGVASLYTREFYQAVSERLERGGMFAQWVQMYSIDAETARTIYATLSAAFPHVQTWTTNPGDVVVIASREPITFDVDAVRARLTREPFRTAAHVAWRVENAEGVLAQFVASEQLSRSFAGQARELNTDDRAVVEFSFARTLGRDAFGTPDISAAAARMGAGRPRHIRGAVDWTLVDANRAGLPYLQSSDPRNVFARQYGATDFAGAAAAWQKAPWTPVNSRQAAVLAHVLAMVGDSRAETLVSRLRASDPIEADAILGLLRFGQRRIDEAAKLIGPALLQYRQNPWPLSGVMESTLTAAAEIARDPTHAPAMLDALSRPYAAYQMEDVRRVAYIAAAWHSGRCSARTIEALAAIEPHTRWMKEILQMRALCYESSGLRELAERAKRELAEYEAAERSDATSSSTR